MSGQALENCGHERRGRAVAVRIRIRCATSGVEPGVQTLGKDVWTGSGFCGDRSAHCCGGDNRLGG